MRALTIHNRNKPRLRPGVTLVEMMVAVSITILMMMATSVVFKSAGAAAGKANSSSEIMQQARALCRQLENDFKGLRPDMPMAVIFETEDSTLNSPRQDRIVFFANGDFQTTGNESGNLARIFYGQARDDFDTPQHLDNPDAPGRRVLTRRYKIMSPYGYPPVNNVTFASWMAEVDSPEEYDNILLESSNESYWKTEDPCNFIYYHFRTWDGSGSQPVDGWKCSMVRRPEVEEIEAAIDALAVEADALQQLYILPDVSDFRIDVWYEGQQEWGSSPSGAAFYWNIKDPDGNTTSTPIDAPVSWGWFSMDDLQHLFGIPAGWPKAIRFTFTLYDRDRRYFPDGKTFTYIVKLPKRT